MDRMPPAELVEAALTGPFLGQGPGTGGGQRSRGGPPGRRPGRRV